MALEELPGLAYRVAPDGDVVIDLFGPGSATLSLADGDRVRIEQRTAYPFDGTIAITVAPARTGARLGLRVRIPAWADGASLRVGDEAIDVSGAGARYVRIVRAWSADDAIVLTLPMPVVVHERTHDNVQESRAPDGTAVRQRVVHERFVGLTRGPLVYATGLVDGYRVGETIRRPRRRRRHVADR